ncbi:hypothetical protein ABW20_dc0106935 [Dactylellina cionopaga]|nr:hypothetical protein ABW20_dc0106935 [Dactylellina cionopaga]
MVQDIQHCTSEIDLGSHKEVYLCRIDFSPAKEPEQIISTDSTTMGESSSSANSTTKTTLSITTTEVQVSTIFTTTTSSPSGPHSHPKITRASRDARVVGRKDGSGNILDAERDALTVPIPAYFNSAEYTPTATFSIPDGIPHSRHNIWWEILFEETASADSASASATLHVWYNASYSTAAITANHTGSIGSWTTTTTWNVVNISPFPSETENVRSWATGGFSAILNDFEWLCYFVQSADLGTSTTSEVIESWPVTLGHVKHIGLQGAFKGTAVYDSLRAAWRAYWGPYDPIQHKLPVKVIFTGVDGAYSSEVTEHWEVTSPFPTGNEADLVRTLAQGGIRSMVTYLSSWSYDPEIDPRTTPLASRAHKVTSEHTVVEGTITRHIIVSGRDVTTVLQPVVTEFVMATKTHTNTLVPLLERVARSAAEKPSQRRFCLSWLPWIFAICFVLLVCTIALAWRSISDFFYKRRSKAKLFRTESSSTLSSSTFNLIPGVRKVSGSQPVDPEKLKGTRNRASKESFESVELD